MRKITMGMFKVRVRVTNPADETRFFVEEFWVDTGALYSFVPEDRLKPIAAVIGGFLASRESLES